MIRDYHKWNDRERQLLQPLAFKAKGDEAAYLRLLTAELGFPVKRAAVEHQLRTELGMHFGDLLARARHSGGKTTVVEKQITDPVYERRIAQLQKDLKDAADRELSDDVVKREIIGLRKLKCEIPDWTLKPSGTAKKSPGAPTLMLSDLHHNEVVDPSQIEWANEFDIDISRRRIQRAFAIATELCMEHMVRPEYPGLVLLLGGDNYSGDIHEELSATNEMQWGPAFMDLQGLMIRGIQELARVFKRLHIVGVPGNHGRTTKKPIAKGYNYTNLDWLLYQQMRYHLEKDDRITWLVPDGTDAAFRIFGHRYLLTHGAQFRGGDGIIGPLGPITRGSQKKQARNVALGSEYDTLVVGHFHQLMMLPSLIVNGSTKGFDEYAYQGNFKFERPAQALWFTHPVHGITSSWPVYVEPKSSARMVPKWVEIQGRPMKDAA